MHTKDNNSEDKPRKINSGDVNFTPPSKRIKAQEKVEIKESGFGREQGQTPADEHIEKNISQIDKGTISLQNGMIEQEYESKINDDSENEINEDDNRDHGDSTKDWDAENNNSGRHK